MTSTPFQNLLVSDSSEKIISAAHTLIPHRTDEQPDYLFVRLSCIGPLL